MLVAEGIQPKSRSIQRSSRVLAFLGASASPERPMGLDVVE
jgi:hypothetical protein